MAEHDRPTPRRWSLPLLVITLALFVVGLALGALTLRQDVPVPEHRPEDNAVRVHLVIAAVVVCASVVATVATRSWRWVVAPWTRRTGARIRSTFRAARGSFLGVLRCVVFVLAASLTGYLVLRMGMQVTAGLDPAFTVNAWGGPSALGAFLAHGVDAVLSIALASVLAHLVLVRAPRVQLSRPPR